MKLHRSKTVAGTEVIPSVFNYHMKPHRSKTEKVIRLVNALFTTI